MIITTTDLSQYMKKTLDSNQATDVVNAVNDFIAMTTGRLWGATAQIVGELHDYKNTIWLNHMDIVSIQQIQMGRPNQSQQVLNSSAYWFNKFGRVVLSIGQTLNPSGYLYDLISVDYTYGQVGVPNDLKLAALQLASSYYNNIANNGQVVTSAGVGTYRLTFSQANSFNDVIEAYRIKRF